MTRRIGAAGLIPAALFRIRIAGRISDRPAHFSHQARDSKVRSSHWRGGFSAALVVLVPLVTPGIISAQSTDSSSSLVGAMKIDLSAGAQLAPGPNRYYSVSGTFESFVSEHWQVGISPAIAASTGRYGNSVGVGLNGTVNYVLSAGRTRWFVGATAGGSGGSGGDGASFLGAQAGALYFPVPTAALRAELRSRRLGNSDGFTSYGAFLTLDSYLPATRSGATSPPDRGAVDVAFDANVDFNGARARSVDLMVAPFFTPWAQVGGTYSAIGVPRDGDWPTSQLFRGFARLYAPLGPGAMPFVEGFVEGARYPYGAHAPTIPGAAAGVRHYLNDGTAFDAALQWRRSHAESGNGYTIPGRDYLRLQAGIVTELRLRARRE
jgi:hypothetical protein